MQAYMHKSTVTHLDEDTLTRQSDLPPDTQKNSLNVILADASHQYTNTETNPLYYLCRTLSHLRSCRHMSNKLKLMYLGIYQDSA